jgi:hypothetical protein
MAADWSYPWLSLRRTLAAGLKAEPGQWHFRRHVPAAWTCAAGRPVLRPAYVIPCGNATNERIAK